MACVHNVNYVVIINGYPTKIFCVGQGHRQGCSLSPLLFILVMDSLSLHIKKVVLEDQFQTLKMGNNISISHNPFVDNILIMGMIFCFSWLCLVHIYSRFANASSLPMNVNKSILYHGQCDLETISYTKVYFPLR